MLLKFQKSNTRWIISFLVLFCIVCLFSAIDDSQQVLAQNAATRASTDKPIAKITTNYATYGISHSSQTSQGFHLPWDSSLNGTILWTSGPHSWSQGGKLTGKISASRGSGLDFASKDGGSFTVISMASGIVIRNDCGFIGFGCIVAIKHDIDGSVMIYAHLQPKDTNLSGHTPLNALQVNTWYPQGWPIGFAGQSGGQPQIHLHIEFRDGNTPCYAPANTDNGATNGDDCGDIGWAGNPIGWDGHVLVDNHYISGYFDEKNECGPGADCDTIFNYDGSAVYGGIAAPFHNFPYQDCYYDTNNDKHCTTEYVEAFVHPTFQCSDQTNCEINQLDPNDPNNKRYLTTFADHGLFSGGGGFLYSTNNQITPPTDITPTTPPELDDGIELCDGSNYGIPCKTYTYVDDNTCTNLSTTEMDNKIQSLKFKGSYVGNYNISLYEDNACATYIARYGSDASDLGGLDNISSSFKIEKLEPADCSGSSDGVTLYANAGYQGHCHTFTPGSYSDLSQFGLDQNVTSIKDPNSAFAVHLNDGLNFTGTPGNFDQDVYDLGPSNWSDRARSVTIERHIPTTCNPTTDGAVLYVDTNYGSGCISVPPDIPDLSVYTMDHALDSLKFFGSYVNTSQVEIFRQANYVDLCNTYWQDQSDLRECAGQAVSVKILPYTPPTAIPTLPGDIYTGNIAPLAYRDHSGSDAVVDGNLSTEWIGGLGNNIGFSWSQNVSIHHIIVWDRAQSSDNNQINTINIGFSDGTSIQNIDMTSGGPRCADVTFPEKSVDWVNVIPADSSGNNGYREVEIWATTGDQFSNNSCVIKYNLTASGGGLQPPSVTATPAISPTPRPTNTPLPYEFLFGDASDGDLTVANTQYTDNTRTQIATSGQSSVTVSSVSGLNINNEVLLFQVQGTNAGVYEFGRIASIGGNTITFQGFLSHSYSSSGNNRAQIIRVLQFNNLTVPQGTTLSAHSWDGTTGGILTFRVSGTLNLGGSISVNSLGFRGSPRNNGKPGSQGEGENGMGGISCSANGLGAGGGGSNGYGDPPAGGGGGYSTIGQYGQAGGGSGGACVGAGGNSIGNPELSTIYFGGGGGSGGAKTNDGSAYYGGAGGAGGGAIVIYARTISGAGTIAADGQSGSLGGGSGTGSNGGGGAGGSVFIAGQSITAGTISSSKGAGAKYTGNNDQTGGDGADGRIRIEYGYSFSATTIPQASVYQSLYLADTPTPTTTYTITPTRTPTPTVTPSRTPTLSPTSTLSPTPTATENCGITSNEWLGEYWNNVNLSGKSVICRYYDDINFNWYGGSPDPRISSDYFSARWSRYLSFESGTYQFNISHDDGARLFIDGTQAFNNWCDNCSLTESVTVHVNGGNHLVVLEMWENIGYSHASLDWQLLDRDITATPSTTPTPTRTYTSTPSPTSSLTATLTSTRTRTPTSTPSLTLTKTRTSTSTVTTTYTTTPTLTQTYTATASLTPTPCSNCILADSAWPMLRQNLLHTGRGISSGPDQPKLVWSFNQGSFDGSSPAIGEDGTIYVGLGTDLYAFTPGGSKKWSYTIGDAVRSPLLTANNTIYVESRNGIFYALSTDGALKWSFPTGGWMSASPAVAPDGTIYFGSSDSYFYALKPDGTQKWKYNIGSWINSSPAIGPDGLIYVGSTTNNVYALYPNGTLKWVYPTDSYIDASPAIAPDGSVYIGSVDKKVYAINPNGTLKWSYTTGDAVYSSPAIGSDGSIYIGSMDGKLYAFNSSGGLLWAYDTGSNIGSSPIIDTDGIIYFGANNGKLYAIHPDGTAKWNLALGNTLGFGAALGANKQIYIVGYATIYAVGGQPTPTPTRTATATATLAPPLVPTLLSPADNTLLTEYTTSLDWSDSMRAKDYQIQIATTNAFSPTSVITDEIVPDSYYPTGNLLPNTTFYWHVRAINSESVASNWSVTRKFRTRLITPLCAEPVIGSTAITSRPHFDWSDTPNAISYTIQVSLYSNFSSLQINTSRTASEYDSTIDLARNRTIYWQVRANGDNPSNWSRCQFLSANSPSVPVPVSPANNSLFYTYLPRLDWTNTSIPTGTTFDHYQLQVATDSTFTSLVLNQKIYGSASSSEYTMVTSLNPNNKYWWRVSAYNIAGQYSNWSSTRYLRTSMVQPQLVSPADKENLTNKRPTFEWTSVEGATSYYIQISKNSSFTSLQRTITISGTGTSYIASSDLPASTTLYWQIRANGTNGPSLYSTPFSFKTGNPPAIPALSSPSNGALMTDYTPRLDWGTVSLPSGTTFDYYLLQVATDSYFTQIITAQKMYGVSNSEYTFPTDIDANTRFYWRVQAFNTDGHYSFWSPTWSFRTALAKPTLLTPPLGATVNTTLPTFIWSESSVASNYTIQISRYSNFSTNLVSTTVSPTSYTSSINLPKGAKLYWRVRANGSNGPSLWSDVYNFLIQ